MLTKFDEIPASERVIVALDCSADEAIALADKLAGKASWVKIGMTLYYAEGPAIVALFKRRGFKVFLDLKFHDIPHQLKEVRKTGRAPSELRRRQRSASRFSPPWTTRRSPQPA